MTNREAYLRGFRDAHLIVSRFSLAPGLKDNLGIKAVVNTLSECHNDRVTRTGFIEHILADGGQREAA